MDCAVSVHAAPTPTVLRALAAKGVPFVATGLCDQWAARAWDLPEICHSFGGTLTCVRLHQRPCYGAAGSVPYEGECTFVRASLAELCAWLRHEVEPAALGALSAFPRDAWVGYCDYQEFASLFASTPAALAAVNWSTVLGGSADCGDDDGLARDGSHSTLWLGSEGASTPLHYDTYGACNWVAQLQGTKQWRLHPPTAASDARACGWRHSRVPYEQSSVYARDGTSGDGATEAMIRGGWVEVELRAGDVLHVPRHWWHGVLTTSDHALSVNCWVDGGVADATERMREASARLVACAMVRAAGREVATATAGADEHADEHADKVGLAGLIEPACGWVNPTEELSAGIDQDLALVWAAAVGAAGAAGAELCVGCVEGGEGSEGASSEVAESATTAVSAASAMDAARVLCIGRPIEVAARQLAVCLAGMRAGAGEGEGEGGGDAGGAHLRAPLARLLRSAIVTRAETMEFSAAWRRLVLACGARRVRLADVVDACCTGEALEAAATALGELVARTANRRPGKRGRDACEHTSGACDCDDGGCVLS